MFVIQLCFISQVYVAKKQKLLFMSRLVEVKLNNMYF